MGQRRRLPVPRPATLIGHTEAVETVAFSADGRTLASGGADRTVRLWDTGSPDRPALLATLTGHIAAITAVAFAADGRRLVTAAADGTVRLWDLDPAWVAGRSCALAYPLLTRSEWGRHFPGIGYRPPCRTALSG